MTVGTITHGFLSIDYTVNIEGLTIKNVAFNDGNKNGFDATFAQFNVNGLTMKGCSMNVTCGAAAAKGNLLYTSTQASIKNIKVENCSVNGARRLASLTAVENLTITENRIENTTEHGILLADTINNGFGGTIVISGNSASNIGDRFLRAENFMSTATVKVEANTITDFGVNSHDSTSVKLTRTNGASVEIKDVPKAQYLIETA